MSRSEVIHVRVTPEVKEKSEAILVKLGISTSHAISLFLNQVLIHDGIPFEISLPNREEVKRKEELAHAINLTGGKELKEAAKKIISLYARGDIDYDTAIYAISKEY